MESTLTSELTIRTRYIDDLAFFGKAHSNSTLTLSREPEGMSNPLKRRPRRKNLITATISITALTVTGLATGTPATAQDPTDHDILISEITNSGPGGSSDNFLEIANYGQSAVDLEGWELYRCGANGSRVNDPQVPAFSDLVLEPGERYTIAHNDSTVEDPDDRYDVSVANAGFGAWLQDADFNIIDQVAAYAPGVDSECALDSTPLRNNLDGHFAHSYQRVDHTGDLEADFIRAERTPGSDNATEEAPGISSSDVLISELTNGGPDSNSDNFVEFVNFGNHPVDIGGWNLYRCTADGRRVSDTLQSEIPAGTVLEPEDVFVAAHESVEIDEEIPHVTYEVSLADGGFGALLEDADGVVRDAVGVYETDFLHQPPTDSPCVQGEALPNRLDRGFDHSYQRIDHSGSNAEDFVKAERTLGEHGDVAEVETPDVVDTGVYISEIINDGPAGIDDNFFELANFSDETVSLDGWNLYRCHNTGHRDPVVQIPEIEDVELGPGDTFVAAHTDSEVDGDAEYDTSFATTTYGLIAYTDDGDIADRVGAYTDHYSPCTDGLSVMPNIDSEGGESFQRYQHTNDNVTDFVRAPRSPGEVPDDLRSPTERTDDELAAVDVDPAARPLPADAVSPGDTVASTVTDLVADTSHTTGASADHVIMGARQLDVAADSTSTYTGATEETPPSSRVIEGEEHQGALPDGESVVSKSVDEFPFQRYEITVNESLNQHFEIAWSGSSINTNELQLYAWNYVNHDWQLLDAAGGMTGGAITLTGTLNPSLHLEGTVVNVLVQDGPATKPAFSDDHSEANYEFKDPAEYDFSFGFMTDTQFLSEAYHSVYADMNQWVAQNQDARKIEYTFHTGDIIERWMNGTHSRVRAESEYQVASDISELLERVGHPYGMLPGNHDDKWGREKDMYNEYFGPERYEHEDWYGGSHADGANDNNYAEMEIHGAKFLLVNLGYYAGTEGIDWANEVISEYPDHNVIFATHEYLDPEGQLSEPETHRWTSEGQRYFDEIVEPNDNVFLVLSGHFHGVALNVQRDEDDRATVEMLADYQNFERNGLRDTGFLRLLQFDIDAQKMAVNSYSPTLDEHNAYGYDPEGRYDADDDEFTIDVDLNDSYDKRVEAESVSLQQAATVIGGENVETGEEVTAQWMGLQPGASYNWYVYSFDGGGRHAYSPVNTFSTLE